MMINWLRAGLSIGVLSLVVSGCDGRTPQAPNINGAHNAPQAKTQPANPNQILY